MDEQQWTGQLDLTVFFDGNRSVSRDIFFEKALKVGTDPLKRELNKNTMF